MTAPLGVLKKHIIEFKPPLSKTKEELIDKTPITRINKVMVEFSEMFWGDQFLVVLHDELYPIFLGINFYLVNGKPIIIFVVNDTMDFALAKYNEDQLKNYVHHKMSACFPGKNVQITKLLKTNWLDEPFTYGAFSDEPDSQDYLEDWAEPEGRLYFAGEHTADRIASTQGAWISGRIRSKQILDRIK